MNQNKSKSKTLYSVYEATIDGNRITAFNLGDSPPQQFAQRMVSRFGRDRLTQLTLKRRRVVYE